MKSTLALICVLVMAVSAFAVTPSVASLKGIYAFNHHSARSDGWFAQVSCPHYSGQLFAGSQTSTQVIDGTMTFDGKGKMTYSAVKYGQFDQALSNQTPTWACDANGNPYITNSGYAVYDAPTGISGTATYAVQSDYTGVINLGGNDSPLILRIAGTSTKGLASNFFVHSLKSNNQSEGDGMGVKQ